MEIVGWSSGFALVCVTRSAAFPHLWKGAPHGASCWAVVYGEGQGGSLALLVCNKWASTHESLCSAARGVHAQSFVPGMRWDWLWTRVCWSPRTAGEAPARGWALGLRQVGVDTCLDRESVRGIPGPVSLRFPLEGVSTLPGPTYFPLIPL